MRSEIVRRWIEAGKSIAENAREQVVCPICQVAVLKVWDVPGNNDELLIERHMLCENCGAYNVLRLTRS